MEPPNGKVALVTGASRGIGAATAIALAGRGAHVVITARDVAGLEEVEDAIFTAGGSATIAPLDLTEANSIAQLAAAIGERWQALDVLVLNAARLGSLTAVPAIDPKEMAAVLTLNVSAQAALIAAFDPMLRASGAGRVIGVTSSVRRHGLPDRASRAGGRLGWLDQRHLQHVDATPEKAAFAVHQVEAPQVDEARVELAGQTALAGGGVETLAPPPQRPGIVEAESVAIGPFQSFGLA